MNDMRGTPYSSSSSDSSSSTPAKRLKTLLKERDVVDLHSYELEELAEVMDVLVEREVMEQLGPNMYYIRRKRSGIRLGHKAFYDHPSEGPPAFKLATKAAMGTLGAAPTQSFKPPSPEEMREYQSHCMETFMKRYEDFYDTVVSPQRQ